MKRAYAKMIQVKQRKEQLLFLLDYKVHIEVYIPLKNKRIFNLKPIHFEL